MTKEEKINLIIKKIEDEISFANHYETRRNALNNISFSNSKTDNITYDQITKKYPEIQDYFNQKLLSGLLQNIGNPDSDNYTFSKTISDKEILENLIVIDKNTELSKKYDENMGDYKKDMLDAKERAGILINKIDNVRQAIRTDIDRFKNTNKENVKIFADDEKGIVGTGKNILNYLANTGLNLKDAVFGTKTELGQKGGPFGLMNIPIKTITQVAAGPLDWRHTYPELDQIENWHFDYNDKIGMSGREYNEKFIKPAQNKLRTLHNELEDITFNNKLPNTDLNYSEIVEDLNKFQELQDGTVERNNYINSTGYDEALDVLKGQIPEQSSREEQYHELMKLVDKINK